MENTFPNKEASSSCTSTSPRKGIRTLINGMNEASLCDEIMQSRHLNISLFMVTLFVFSTVQEKQSIIPVCISALFENGIAIRICCRLLANTLSNSSVLNAGHRSDSRPAFRIATIVSAKLQVKNRSPVGGCDTSELIVIKEYCDSRETTPAKKRGCQLQLGNS